ncbi:cysteine dioxygenase [Herbaspirillum lusitanum]|uniref:Cysteine dioxygenase n=1 Tax=Herbaspirillum lusitanum TaxID=213312 RepID=A0ABW9ABI2_9BURK
MSLSTTLQSSSEQVRNVPSGRLEEFVTQFSRLLDAAPSEADVLQQGGELLRKLVRFDDWLPQEFAQPDAQHYRQYLLHLDPAQRFSVVSFVWGPGQKTPVHDHTVWGLIGVLRGAEYSQSYALTGGALQAIGAPHLLERGVVEAVSPHAQGLHDIHLVRNAHEDRTSVSIHVYGANIGAVERSLYYQDGTRKRFVSGYSNLTPVDS